LREAAFLLKGITIELVDERNELVTETYQYPDGLKDFVTYLNEEKDGLHDVVAFVGKNQEKELDFAFHFNDGFAENILSFVNNERTKDGGTHEAGAKTAITRVVNDYAKKVNLLKEKDKNLEGNDIREGFTAVISVRIPEEKLQFEGQTKSKLGSAEARSAVDAIVAEHLLYFLEENLDTATMLIKKARSEEHTSELQSRFELVCRRLL